MSRKTWGFLVGGPDPRRDIAGYLRESRLGTGANPASAPASRRYYQDGYTDSIYPAEQALRQMYADDPEPTELWFPVGDVAAVQAYVNEILSWPWSRWHPWPCTVKLTPEPSPDYASGIRLPRNPRAWRELVVLHELAHHFAKQQVMEHGLLFRSAFSEILADVMGLDARERFRQCLREQGVSD